MTYSQAFFDLQLQFARRVTILSGLPLDRALLEYTNLYARFGLGRNFDPAHPVWREYLAGLERSNDMCDWTYCFYSRRPDAMSAPGVVATFGCFSYSRMSDDRIRLHFQNAGTSEGSSLGMERVEQRMADLTALFEHVKGALPPPPQVVGASWLYNLEAYRRLFPASYLSTARVLGHRYRHMPLWGQFLDRRGEVKASLARQFLECLEGQESVEGLDQCFPFQVLVVTAPPRAFYDFYGI